ncbi:MAG TPA: ABC transporter permease, partial [Telluria sp.]|nr:ABC transporter permease [Telluria sp.]
MNYSLLADMTLTRLGRNKVKTCMMGVGIVISVLATVLVQVAGDGFRGAFDTFINRAYPADSVWLVSGGGLMGGGGTANRLRLSDVEAVRAAVPEIVSWDPIVQGGARDLKHGGQNAVVPVTGLSDAAQEVRRRGVAQGEFLSAEDIATRAHVVLVGSTTARKLFGNESPIGAQLYLDNVAFTVKGVLDAAGVDPHGGDQDDMVQLPYTTLMEQMLHTENITGVTFTVADRTRVADIGKRIETLMRTRHQIGAGQEDDFTVTTPLLMQDLVARSFRIFTIFVPLIGATAFVISGLVVLGVMLVAIRQRTSEIGLRKALGARPRDLQAEIVIEAGVIALISALVGLILAQLALQFLAPLLAERFGVSSLHLGGA